MNDNEKMMIEAHDIIQKVSVWHKAQEITVEPLAGLTNRNFLVHVDGAPFVLRVSGCNADNLGVRRDLEYEVLRAVSRARIGPEVVASHLPEGHLVTRYIDGQHLSLEEYRKPENLKRILKMLSRLHELPATNAVFSPFRRVEQYAVVAQSFGVPLPQDYDQLKKKMMAIKREQDQDPTPWYKFCHNDLFCVNVLDDGEIHFIDWEFAGMGDIYFDLATLTYAYDSSDTLSPELQKYLVKTYFGEVDSHKLSRLRGMNYMLMFFTAMWGLVQQGLQDKKLVPQLDDFSFIEYSSATFESMRELELNSRMELG